MYIMGFLVHFALRTVFSHLSRSVSDSRVTMETKFGERPDASSPQSEAVANELQDLSLRPAPSRLPLTERRSGESPFVFSHKNQKSKCCSVPPCCFYSSPDCTKF